ncbi:DUF3034 family protein [Marinicella sp. S1101]|uniref:DUF3034 family protein n=1 Tax=Marinicella marina TaxID=2996016 RepID=UPI002260C7A9|nr:DUF3034 family protein [Marinicella marina]MCX7554286.1 DUF3034 family protein [Marinicella marina]MDJ1138723.1 DUF3034 family protein [Marinicella marina]
MKKLILLGALMCSALTHAGSRQLGTGAVMQVEGASGSGIVPWATIAGYGEKGETDFTAAYTYLDTDDYRFDMVGAAVGWHNRVELSFAKQELDLLTLGPALDLPGASLRQDVIGLKVRLAGNLVYSKMPQIAFGIQHKKNQSFLIPSVAGARDDQSMDYYLSATKLFLGKPAGFNGFVTLTLRSTEANEMGLLGFGGDIGGRDINAEASIGLFLNKSWAIGFDYRQKRSNLSFASEDSWRDVFVVWVPNRHISVVAAYADLGKIATLPEQKGLYLSINGSF